MTAIPPITEPIPTPEPRRLLDAVLALVALLPDVDRETVALSSDALRLASDARAQLTAEKAAREEAEHKEAVGRGTMASLRAQLSSVMAERDSSRADLSAQERLCAERYRDLTAARETIRKLEAMRATREANELLSATIAERDEFKRACYTAERVGASHLAAWKLLNETSLADKEALGQNAAGWQRKADAVGWDLAAARETIRAHVAATEQLRDVNVHQAKIIGELRETIRVLREERDLVLSRASAECSRISERAHAERHELDKRNDNSSDEFRMLGREESTAMACRDAVRALRVPLASLESASPAVPEKAKEVPKRSFSQLESDVRAPETSVLAVPHDEPTDRDRAIVEAAERWRECDLDCSNVRGRLDALADAVDLPKTPDVLAPGPHGDLPPELEHPANQMAREAMRRERCGLVFMTSTPSDVPDVFCTKQPGHDGWHQGGDGLGVVQWDDDSEVLRQELLETREKLRLTIEQMEACRQLLESADRAFKVGPVKPLNWEERLDASRKERGKTDAK